MSKRKRRRLKITFATFRDRIGEPVLLRLGTERIEYTIVLDTVFVAASIQMALKAFAGKLEREGSQKTNGAKRVRDGF